MQILMHSTICRSEYSCGLWAGCPCSGPNPAFLLPSLFWHADKEQQGKEQGGENKVNIWQKFTSNFMTLGNRREAGMNYFYKVLQTSRGFSNISVFLKLSLDSWGICPCIRGNCWRTNQRCACFSSLQTSCEYLTLLLTVFWMDTPSSRLPLISSGK